MKSKSYSYLEGLINRYPELVAVKTNIIEAVDECINTIKNGGKLLICGNGGSAADSEHIVGELMKGFVLRREIDNELKKMLYDEFPHQANYFIENLQQSIPAISLVSQSALISAYSNDNAPDLVFAQQVLGYGIENDILFAISTSGNSKNVVFASQIARAKKLKVLSLTGKYGGKLKKYSDVQIAVPEEETYKVQELHLPIYHAICLILENEIFGD